ncbi:hypothetical protein KFK09_015603 [Dendrobium nobile]|uniref:RING-type E3 ubiquitin transferase n=1 Tax=Dendrobium nobile TaxID=94219 RepID=A0A8T3B6F9_DENNO|nr:hypothetical protein KFK09_015603 [Dendrobium nobile]
MGFQLQRSVVEEHGSPETSATPPPPPQQKPAVVPFRPSVAVIVVVLTTMFSLTFLLLLYAKHCRRQAAAAAAAAASAAASGGVGLVALSGTAEDRTSGVERAVVESLPVFRFASLMGEKDGLECAVCLGRFEAEELLRLLPKCRHAFHVNCVDAWLESHSTCPLCRSRIHPEDVLLLRRPDPMLPQVSSVAAAPPARRVSGRHSSAGEKTSGCTIVVSTERQRKDGLLLSAAAEGEGDGGRYSHRVVFSGGGSQERWSDLRPSDLMFLRSETTITGSGRFSAAAGAGGGARVGPRNAGVITGVSRTGATEDRTMRRWLGFATKRTAGWLGGGSSG